jgi:hypothetical protein
MVASRKLTEDPRAEAEYGERVPYVITTGEAHRLVDRAMAPEELLNNRYVVRLDDDAMLTRYPRELKLDAEYYIRRQLIPPLNRILNLIGVDCENWYNAMPKRQLASNQHRYKSRNNQKEKGLGRTLDTAFTSIHCLVCGQVNQKRGEYISDRLRHTAYTNAPRPGAERMREMSSALQYLFDTARSAFTTAPRRIPCHLRATHLCLVFLDANK